MMNEVIIIGKYPLDFESFEKIVFQKVKVELFDDPDYIKFIQKGCDYLSELSKNGDTIYGVTTGFGESCSVSIQGEGVHNLPKYLARFHGCGLGENFSPIQSRAILLARIVSLAKGYSALRIEVLERLIFFLNHDLIPRIPQEGSVGASGDLTPLSYIAARLMGERELYDNGVLKPTKEVFSKRKIEPLELKQKETLGIMNGTSAMTGIAVLCYKRAERIAKLCCRLTSMGLISLKGNRDHFLPKLFDLKPHPGQKSAADLIYRDLNDCKTSIFNPSRVQERYSYRCAPHVVGVLMDALPLFKNMIMTELNSVNDNPIIDPGEKTIYHGGHFYGGHIAFAMDSLKNLIANQADLLDRQLAILVNYRSNNGLPKNLSGASGPLSEIHHGFKAVQIGVSAFTAEALKNTIPASVFSRSTECHNQDKVSMGTHAARDCFKVIELTEQVLACVLLACHQAINLRFRMTDFSKEDLSKRLIDFLDLIESYCPFIEEDIEMEPILRKIQLAISKGEIA